VAEIGNYCAVSDKCIYFISDECMGVNHENCPIKQSIINGNFDKAAIKRIKSGFIDNGIFNKAVLITGGSGSFGSAFCEYVKAKNLKPRKLVVFSRDYMKQQALKEKVGDLKCMQGEGCWITGDVRDLERLKKAFNGIDIVIHAAAMKHIQNCENDPQEALLTNVIGTNNVVEAALYRKVQKTILISTDKCVESITTYGTTKAMAEALIIGGNKYKGRDNVKFSVCRYGNVCGSAGSVMPKFKKLISEGAKELPITDEKMTRFWFKMDNAIRFVLESLDKMQGGETFIPKIPSIRLVDLCKAFDMPYKVVGLRCKEKLHEKLTAYYDSGTNPEFLNIDEIKESIKSCN
jgi:UDP-N-acetylglucosamine 4,6-dehydratase